MLERLIPIVIMFLLYLIIPFSLTVILHFLQCSIKYQCTVAFSYNEEDNLPVYSVRLVIGPVKVKKLSTSSYRTYLV